LISYPETQIVHGGIRTHFF